MMRLDHIAISATTLAEGVTAVESALGVTLAPGGQHPLMATHNRLLGLGDLYLEVIAIDPDAPPPAQPRWFDLDRFSGPPRLTNWIAATDDLDAELATGPDGWGTPVSLTRGDFSWRMAVPPTGRLPFDDTAPALMQWNGTAHPSQRLPDSGLRLTRLEVSHPDGAALSALLSPRLTDPRVILLTGPRAMRASFDTPHGPRVITG